MGVFSLPYLNGTWDIINFAHSKVWGNRLLITLDDNLEKETLKLIFKNDEAIITGRGCFPFINEHSSGKVLIDTLYSNSEQLKDIPYFYGKQSIEVFFDDEPIGQLYLWKTNDWHAHDYQIEIKDSLGFAILNGDVKGPDKKIIGGVQYYDKSYVSFRIEKLKECFKPCNLRIDKYQVEDIDNETGMARGVKFKGVRVTYIPTGQSVSIHKSDDVLRNYWYALRKLKEMKVYY